MKHRIERKLKLANILSYNEKEGIRALGKLTPDGAYFRDLEQDKEVAWSWRGYYLKSHLFAMPPL